MPQYFTCHLGSLFQYSVGFRKVSLSFVSFGKVRSVPLHHGYT